MIPFVVRCGHSRCACRSYVPGVGDAESLNSRSSSNINALNIASKITSSLFEGTTASEETHLTENNFGVGMGFSSAQFKKPYRRRTFETESQFTLKEKIETTPRFKQRDAENKALGILVDHHRKKIQSLIPLSDEDLTFSGNRGKRRGRPLELDKPRGLHNIDTMVENYLIVRRCEKIADLIWLREVLFLSKEIESDLLLEKSRQCLEELRQKLGEQIEEYEKGITTQRGREGLTAKKRATAQKKDEMILAIRRATGRDVCISLDIPALKNAHAMS